MTPNEFLESLEKLIDEGSIVKVFEMLEDFRVEELSDDLVEIKPVVNILQNIVRFSLSFLCKIQQFLDIENAESSSIEDFPSDSEEGHNPEFSPFMDEEVPVGLEGTHYEMDCLKANENYQYGSVLDALPDMPFHMPNHPETSFDESYFSKLLLHSLCLNGNDKAQILGLIPGMMQSQVEGLIKTLEEEQNAWNEIPSETLAVLKPVEYESAQQWCEIQETLWHEVGDLEKSNLWGETVCRLKEERLAILNEDVEVIRKNLAITPTIRSLCARIIGEIELQKGFFDTGIQQFKKVEQDSEEFDVNPLIEWQSLVGQGQAESLRGNFENGILLLNKARDLAETSKLGPLAICNCLIFLGQVEAVRGNLEKGIGLLKEAKDLADEHKYEILPLTRCNLLFAMGALLKLLGHTVEGIQSLKEAILVADTNNLDPMTTVNCLMLLGGLETQNHNPEEGIRLFSKASQQIKEHKHVLDPLSSANCSRGLGDSYFLLLEYDKALLFYKKFAQSFLKHLGQLSFPAGIHSYLSVYRISFCNAQQACEQLWMSLPSGNRPSDYLGEYIQFDDIYRGTSIREGLRRHSSLDAINQSENPERLQWQAGPADWKEAISVIPSGAEAVMSDDLEFASPGLMEANEHDPERVVDTLLELPEQGGTREKSQFCQPLSSEEISTLLSDTKDIRSVILLFTQSENDFVVIPICHHPQSGELHFITDSHSLFRCPNVAQQLAELAELQADILQVIKKNAFDSSVRKKQSLWDDLVNHPSRYMNDIHPMQRELYDKLYELLRMRDLLSLLKEEGLDLQKLSLTIIPDEVLWKFPLEAAYSKLKKCHFYEEVNSIRYALSLQTLLMQQEIDQNDYQNGNLLQATLFANPNGGEYLPMVEREVEQLIEIFNPECLDIYDEKSLRCTRKNLREQHGLGTLLWIISHGGRKRDEVVSRDGRELQVRRPSALMFDGPVSDVRMVEEGYSYRHVRLIHANACLLGRMGQSPRSKELEGFVASLTLLGSRRISSARWELWDFASCEFAAHYAKALVEHAYVKDPSPHAFATAFKQGIDQFRQMDNGKFDHPFFWAPYFLCGLG